MIARGTPQTFADLLEHYRGRVAGRIRAALDADDEIPSSLVEAIEYSVLGPGKRVRPLLVYAAGECLGLRQERLDAPAAAIELNPFSAIKGAVEAGMGVSIVSEVTIHKELQLGTLVALELEPGQMKPFVIADQRLLLVNADGNFYVVDEMCSHEDYSLALGCIKGKRIKCSLHGSYFDLASGQALDEPADEPICTYPVKTENGKVWVNVG